MLKRTFALVLCVVASAGLQAGHAQDQFVVPPSDGRVGLCEPFECSTRIQQVMNGSLFPAKMRIEAIILYNDVPHSAEGYVEPAHYQFFLSETGVSSETITTDFDANVGPNNTQVIDWTVSDYSVFFRGGLTLPLSKPFTYDPRRGNLLIEIIKDRTSRDGDGPIYVDGNIDVDGVAMLSSDFGIRPRTGMTVGFVGKFLVQQKP
jgi:hypothetical protein